MYRDDVIDRVKKLLALAGANTNVNEAALAMARAQRLMLEHKLATAELESADERDDVTELVVEENKSRHETWKSCLIAVLARVSCCSVVQGSNIYKGPNHIVSRFTIVGTEADASYVAYAHQYLVNEINRLCEAAGVTGRAQRNAFRRGAVNAIGVALTSVRSSVQATRNALLVINRAQAAADAYVKTAFGPLRSSSAPGVRDWDSYRAGQAAGRTVSLPGRNGQGKLGPEPKKLRASR